MLNNLINNISNILSDNDIDTFKEYTNIDLIKENNRHIGFISVKEIEKNNSYRNALEKECFESIVTVECKIIAQKGVTANSFSQTINNIFTDFIFSDDIMPISIKMENLKINSLYSRFESNLILKFSYYFS